MLNERQIEMLPERIYQRLSRVNSECLQEIGSIIKEIGELRPSDTHKLQQIYSYGANGQKMAERLAKESAKNIEEIYEIFDVVAKENYNYAKPFYKAKDKPFIAYEENEDLKRYVKSLAKQTVDEYVNLTQHTAFAVFAPDGKSIAPLFDSNKGKMATSLSDTYTKVIDYAVTKAQMGVTDYNSAVRDVVEACAKSGIKTVDYATGYSRRLDTAVRQNVLWGIKQCNQNTADMIGEDFGADGYEISYHSNPRPSHAEMGGKQYAIGKARTIKGVEYPSFSEVESLLEDFGCLHFKFSILLGVSEPAYSKEQLAQFKANDNKTFEFEGKKYTGYEATQVQRKLETAIRNQKDIAVAAKAAGNDELRQKAQQKINLLTSKYHKFSSAADLPTKMERLNVKGFRSVKVKPPKSLTNSGDGGIISSGAVSGARNPYGTKAQKHAEQYYDSVRAMKTDVSKIAKATGYTEFQIQQIKDYVFYEKHDLGGFEKERFAPDYMMSESWRRLINGTPEPHDLTLLKHEQLEMKFIKEGYNQREAHILATQKYDYNKEALEFYDRIKKYKD